MHRFPFRVRYGDTDQMGMAYYANYLRWFEVGRAEMLRSLGSSYRAVEEAGIRLPVLEARCRYLRPARYDDALVVETGILALRRAAVTFGYRVRLAEDDTLLAHGITEHCYLDPNGKPVRPPAWFQELLARAPRAEEIRPGD